MFKPVSSRLNIPSEEEAQLRFWKTHDIFKRSSEDRKDRTPFVMFEGPPTANGKPGVHHVLARAFKDMFPRYKTMQGYFVDRRGGWDTHGLPVEIEVEKMLGFTHKSQIEEYGIAEFNKLCRESAFSRIQEWEKMTDRIGYWVDEDRAYVTYTNDYIESVWSLLKTIWDKGFLYQGHKVVPYCPRCGTPLSDHEVALGYDDAEDPSLFVRFPLVDEEDTSFLVWTTTPWTLPGNVAIATHPDVEYALVTAEGMGDEKFILANDLVEKVFGDRPFRILKTMKGKSLKGKCYMPLYTFFTPDKPAYYVVNADYVTTDDGTGLVHIAPAFGMDDMEVARQYDLPMIMTIDDEGRFLRQVQNWAGVFVKDADQDIIQDLHDRGLLFHAGRFNHTYPFCWRCRTPLLYMARPTWFIKTSAIKERMVELNQEINWVPEHIKNGRFGNWLENNIDWALGRNRYWGTPLNIWECPCGHQHSVGSIEELKSMSDNCPEDIELHRPYIDEVTIKCPECGGEMHRVPEVIDCWFDSGSMPFAQHHYPFENKDLFEQQFPADFISEAVDQTRGWFYSLLAISTLLFNKAPYKNVIVLGHVQDENGQKMSKSKGNAVDPFDALEQYGADAIRWYFYVNSAPWLPNRFHGKAVQEGQRKFMGTLWNTYAFFVLYANIDDFDATKYSLEYDKLNVMDKWLLSRLNTLVKLVDENLENYRIPESARALQDFVDDMSNWYVRRSRERFWAKGMEQDKINAYMTLYTALVTVSKAAAPMIPFMAEEIYQNLVCSIDSEALESIHLCDFPSVHEEYINKDLEADMSNVLKLVVMGRACRNTANIKNRQPIGRMFVKASFVLPEFYKEIVADELNVKNIEFTEDVRAFTSYSFKPQLKTVGPKYGKMLGSIKPALNNLDGNAAMDEVNETGSLKLNINDQEVTLFKEDLLIDTAQMEGYVSENDNGITVVLDTNLTEELLEEGFVREIISKIQTMRKEADFQVMDKIKVTYTGSEEAESIFAKYGEEIRGEVLADKIIKAVPAGYVKEWKVNGEAVTMGVEKEVM